MDKEHLAYAGIAIMTALNPSALVGASVGCVFFMMSPFAESFRQKLGYTIVSLGIGYAAGYGIDNKYSMLAAALTAAVAVAGVDVLRNFMRTLRKVAQGEDMPSGLKQLLEIIRGFTK